MRNKAVINMSVEDVRRITDILDARNIPEAFRFLVELDKKITEATEPH